MCDEKEMTLAEYIDHLRKSQPCHLAVREFDGLQADLRRLTNVAGCRSTEANHGVDDAVERVIQLRERANDPFPAADPTTPCPACGRYTAPEAELPHPVILMDAQQPGPREPERLLSSTPLRRIAGGQDD